MKNSRRNRGSASTVAVSLRCGRLLRSLPQLRSTATVERQVRGRLDSQVRLLGKETINNENKSHWVTPLLAQRCTLSGNSYFWRTAGHRAGSSASISPSPPSD